MMTPASGGMRALMRERKPWKEFSSPKAASRVPMAPEIPVVILNLLSSKPSRLLSARPPE